MKLILTLLAILPLARRVAASDAPGSIAGPIEYPGMRVVVDSNGVHAPGYRFDNQCAKPTPWQAQWIAGGRVRKELTLDAAPVKVTAWIMADRHYQLWINGRLVSRGPVDQGRDFAGGVTHRWLYDYRDLTPFFHKGKNIIAAKASERFLFEAQVDKLTVKSDTTWRVAPAQPADGWQAMEFDDTAWPAASLAQGNVLPLMPSEIPPRMEAKYPPARIEGLPENKTFITNGNFKVVFNRVLSAYPTVTVRGGKGASVTIKAHGEQKFSLSGGKQTLEFDAMTEIAPAFTVEFQNVTEPVEVVDAGAIFTSQPVEYRGSFACSDEELNQLWKVSRWAVQICLQTHHLDSPNHQEPISDPGDYLIEAMVNHYAFAQPWLVRQDIRKFAWLLKDENYHNFHTSYSIGWLQMLMDYYDYTGDQKLVIEMAPYVHELMDTYASWRGKNGIISEAPNYMFMDWVNIGGFSCHHPPAVIGQGYLTAFYYHGMEMATRVAALMGDTARIQGYAQLRKEIATAFQRELWNEAKGLYRDGKPFQTSVQPGKWLPPDKDIETFSPHVNLLAVLYDLAPRVQQAAVVEKVLAEKRLNTQPWFMHWVFQAIDHAGLFDRHATPQIRRWQIVPDTQSFKEMWTGGDLSHGWCSTPLVQMSQRILGVEPTAPGFKTMAVRPHVCDLDWAKGSVPTPNGDVTVSWKWAGDKIMLDVTIPSGSEADVILPSKTVRVSGGHHRFESEYRRVPVAVVEPEPKPVAVHNEFLRWVLARVEDHHSHSGGGKSTDALFNGTTGNGDGGLATKDDGKTFRGYGTGDWLTLHFKQPCDLSEIQTFAAAADSRASQAYSVFAAHAGDSAKFVKLATASKPSDGGATGISLPVKAAGVVAVRFEFANGPLGFNVYREINVIGKESGN